MPPRWPAICRAWARSGRRSLGWGEPDLAPSSFFRIYRRLFDAEASIKLGTIDGEPAMRHGDLQIRRQSALSPPGIEISFLGLPPPTDARTQITDEWDIG